MQRRARTTLMVVIAAAALSSAVPTALNRVRWSQKVASADERQLAELLWHDFAPLVRAAHQHVPESGAVLLETRLDPAAVPYALFPREVFMRGVEPDSDHAYFEVAPTGFPRRPASSFGFAWHALVDRGPDGALGVRLAPPESPR